MSIGGRCRCNGHADLCDITDPADSYKLICRCQHNTCGHNCERCCPGFEQKAWSQSKYDKLFACERKSFPSVWRRRFYENLVTPSPQYDWRLCDRPAAFEDVPRKTTTPFYLKNNKIKRCFLLSILFVIKTLENTDEYKIFYFLIKTTVVRVCIHFNYCIPNVFKHLNTTVDPLGTMRCVTQYSRHGNELKSPILRWRSANSVFVIESVFVLRRDVINRNIFSYKSFKRVARKHITFFWPHFHTFMLLALTVEEIRNCFLCRTTPRSCLATLKPNTLTRPCSALDSRATVVSKNTKRLLLNTCIN